MAKTEAVKKGAFLVHLDPAVRALVDEHAQSVAAEEKTRVSSGEIIRRAIEAKLAADLGPDEMQRRLEKIRRRMRREAAKDPK